MKRFVSFCCVLALLFTALPFSAFAANSSITGGADVEYSVNENLYVDYLAQYANGKNATQSVVLNGNNFVSASKVISSSHTDNLGVKFDNTAVNTEDGGYAVYNFNIPEDGFYDLSATYVPLNLDGNDIIVKLEIDGKYLFDDAEEFELPRYWKDDGDFRTDKHGNEYAPPQVETGYFQTVRVYDRLGIQNFPYKFYLTKGVHTVKFTFDTGKIALAKIGFIAPEAMLPYEELEKIYEQKGYKSADKKTEPIVIEAEDAYLKNTLSAIAKSDCGSAEITPASAVLELVNYFGGANWKTPNDEVVWKFTVKEPGLYKLGMLYKQDLNLNLFSYRYIKIDGETPFAECANTKFGYGIGWEYQVLGGEKDPYAFYLDAGEHTISLKVTLGETSEMYEMLKYLTDDIGNLYLDMTMITGETPDSNRDYELHKQIPQFVERLTEYKNTANEIIDKMNATSAGDTNSFIAALQNMARVLNNMITTPYEAQDYIPDYYTNYSTVASWLYDMKNMPLCIDQFCFTPLNGDFYRKEVSFFEDLSFGFKRFIASFSDIYEVDNKTDDSKLTLWVNWGRDQSMILNSLISERFTPATGIDVDLKITSASLLMGMLSGNAPDLSLHMGRSEPVNLAMRGALYDLTQFDDYEDQLKKFAKGAEEPYKYKGGVYALPDVQGFYCMFYRKDVLQKLGVGVPQTWDDFLAAANILQINNMDVWLPEPGGVGLYASLLQQRGGQIYNDERNATELNGVTAYNAFKYWVDMYTKKKIPVSASFYNRLRSGTMPLGIDAYTLYTTLTEAAPEIQGRWGIALVPGTERVDAEGNKYIDRTIVGSGSGCVIIKPKTDTEATRKKVQNAWEFLKWWTEADTQLSYNNNVESVLGSVARTATSNIEAFAGMAWDKDDLKILLEQRSYIKEVPEVPGSYFLVRSIDQAFWNVINSNVQPKDALYKWADICNNEIERKIKEYS